MALDAFGRADNSSFFRNVRPAIEQLAIYLMFDIWGDEAAIYDLLEGVACVEKDYSGNFSFRSKTAKYKPVGRALFDLLSRVYFCKHSDVYSSKNDDKKKRLRRDVESYCVGLSRYYGIASEAGSHAGKTSLDLQTQAISCAAFVAGLIDFVKVNNIVSNSAIKFLDSLKPFPIGVVNGVSEDEFNKLKLDSIENERALRVAEKLKSDAEQRVLELKKEVEELKAEKDRSIQEFNDRLRSGQGLALAQAQRMKEEAAHIELELKKKNEELEDEINRRAVSSDAAKSVAPVSAPAIANVVSSRTPMPVPVAQPAVPMVASKSSLRANMIVRKDWEVDEATMDDDQLDLIDYTIDKPMIVAGCAGCGKSVIAMHKARQLSAAGFDVILIAFTKSLNLFMQNGGIGAKYKFYYYHQWKVDMCMPSADYIIVDEIQDFTCDEISEFIRAARKHFLFFGDTAQSIYRKYNRATMSIEEIAKMTGLNVLYLYNNYRLPRPVAKITQAYVGVDVPEYKDKVYQNKENELPHFVHYDLDEAQFGAVERLVCANMHRCVGILLPSNSDVLKVRDFLYDKKIQFEYKYNSKTDVANNADTLNFNTLLPKVMTYHSAKGLQFDLVILPFFCGAKSVDSRKPLYVAMTRTMHSLYVLYSTPSIEEPLNKVPTHLYLKA